MILNLLIQIDDGDFKSLIQTLSQYGADLRLTYRYTSSQNGVWSLGMDVKGSFFSHLCFSQELIS